MTRSLRIICAAFSLLLAISAVPAEADAHLATFGSWEVTREYLGTLFPKATNFLVKKHEYDDAEVRRIEKKLGFELYPEDRTPTFYVAVRKEDGKKKFLGVAMFIDPRVDPKADGQIVRLEVGIGVDPAGRIERVRVFDYRGGLGITRPNFLEQFAGMKLGDDFDIDDNPQLEPAKGQSEPSQLVANAAYEALYLMKLSLGS